MFDDEGDEESEEILPPSNVMWDNVLTLQQRSIFFDIHYYDPGSPFLDYAPSYASSNQLDPVPLIQWHVKSLQFFHAAAGLDSFFVSIGVVSLTDLRTILLAIKPIAFNGFEMQLSLRFPKDAPPSIAYLLPENITELSISPPSYSILDPSVIPGCIHSLPNLEYLNIYLNMSGDEFQPCNKCTTARYSFRSLTAGNRITNVHLMISRSSGPVWCVHIWDRPRRRYIDESDPGCEIVDFEIEVKEWLRLSTSLQWLEIYFEHVEQTPGIDY
jgi:hypothetical protein